MDYPNIKLVIQAGLPSSREQYIHRVRRTARAGKDGRAITILFKNELFFLKTNQSLPIHPYPTPITTQMEKAHVLLQDRFAQVDIVSRSKAYQAFLGYNKTYMKKLQLDTKSLVELANGYAWSMGCRTAPAMVEAEDLRDCVTMASCQLKKK